MTKKGVISGNEQAGFCAQVIGHNKIHRYYCRADSRFAVVPLHAFLQRIM